MCLKVALIVRIAKILACFAQIQLPMRHSVNQAILPNMDGEGWTALTGQASDQAAVSHVRVFPQLLSDLIVRDDFAYCGEFLHSAIRAAQ